MNDMKYYFQVVFILAISFLMSNDANAQLRKKTTSSKKEARIKEKEDKPSFLEEINPELRFGNLGFFNGLSISTKMNVGYKISERFTAGIGGKLFYDQLSAIGPDPSITSYGGLVHARGKITNEIYIQGEYAFMDYERFVQDQVGNLFIQEAKINTPLIGLGYMSGTGKWRFGVELLYIVNDQAREFQGAVIEYWFGASYNF
jgi:hypothetical protein